MFRYLCPRCKKSMSAQDGEAGSKLDCPHCGQRILVPTPPQPPKPPINKTTLGQLEDNRGKKTVIGTLDDDLVPTVEPALPQGGLEPVPAMPKVILVETVDKADDNPWAALNEDEPERPVRRRRKSKWSCPYCDSTEAPIIRRQVGAVGWVMFAVLLLFFFPLCFLGLMMTDENEYCADCGSKLRTRGQAFGFPGSSVQ